MSWRPDPGTIATDALSQSWKEIKGFAFLPFSLIGRCLSKVKREKVSELILVAPVWPTQPWFAVLLLMLYQRAIILPKYPSLLINPLNEPHPLIHQLNLAMWPVSGIPSRVKEFQDRHQVSSYPHGEKEQRQHIPAIGEDGSDGVPHLDATLFVRLWVLSRIFWLVNINAEGKQYRILNAYRSAISMTHSPIDGIGQASTCSQAHERSLQYSASTAQIYDHLGCGASIASYFISGEEQGPHSETAFSQTCSTASTCQC